MLFVQLPPGSSAAGAQHGSWMQRTALHQQSFTLLPSGMLEATPASWWRPSLAEPSPRARQMVEALLLRQLVGRRMLPGNVAALPIFGQQALFVVAQVACSGSSTRTVPTALALQATAEGSAVELTPLVTAATSICLLLDGETIPDSQQPEEQASWQDLPTLAAAAAADALGCSQEDAGAVAARRAAAAGQASKGITFQQLGGVTSQVRNVQFAASSMLGGKYVLHFCMGSPACSCRSPASAAAGCF